MELNTPDAGIQGSDEQPEDGRGYVSKLALQGVSQEQATGRTQEPRL